MIGKELRKVKYSELLIQTNGEKFYNITRDVRKELKSFILDNCSDKLDGVVHLFIPHTSCALCVNEAHDDKAHEDCETFLKHLAPRNLRFITHVDEGPDDSPSHMKSILLQPSLTFIVENGDLAMGTWQGIYLCEFRDGLKNRKVRLKYQPDMF
jgi:secondary thiamine-phosphate synthase enzyme